ncbi:MAG: hypothetical protein XU15_C0011G0026 [candidate division NC10 bacterium CSP1-5]|nr:MAG: hypothetical protein XU15_C0011G0026 [candidate division NC10 bacterium CSP1-5]
MNPNPVDRANKLVSSLVEAGWIEDGVKAAALIAAIAPVIRDAELAAAEHAAKKMRVAAMAALYDAGSDDHLIVRTLNPEVIARQTVEEDA